MLNLPQILYVYCTLPNTLPFCVRILKIVYLLLTLQHTRLGAESRFFAFPVVALKLKFVFSLWLTNLVRLSACVPYPSTC